MNYRVLAKMIGCLLVLLSLAESSCLLFAYLDGESGAGFDAVEAFAFSVLATVFVGGTLIALGGRSESELLRRESLCVVGLGWVICTLFGALPFFLCEPRMGIVDSIFESVSGFTTTGATVIEDLSHVPRSLLLWRSVTQWLGGMGILVLFVALLSSFGASSKALFRHESSAIGTESLSPRIQRISVWLWSIYIGLSIVCFAGLKLLGMGAFDALCHAFATVSTGGFGTHNESVAFFNSLFIELWIVVFMILGSVNFMVYAWLFRRQWERWRQDEASKGLLWVIGLGTLVVALDLYWLEAESSLLQSLRQALFQVVSVLSTSGFTTADFGEWPALSEVVLLLMMLIGGCAGSTSGGIKLGRWILFFKIVRQHLRSAFRPNLVTSLKLNGNAVTDSFRIDTLFVISIAGVSICIGTLIVSLLQPDLDIDSCLSATLAVLFNIGPGLGAVGPMHNYSFLNDMTKIVLSFLMLLGRLEFYALLVLFMPSLWKRY